MELCWQLVTLCRLREKLMEVPYLISFYAANGPLSAFSLYLGYNILSLLIWSSESRKSTVYDIEHIFPKCHVNSSLIILGVICFPT